MATIRDTAKARAKALPPVPASRVAYKTVQGEAKKPSLLDAFTKIGTKPAPLSQDAQNIKNRQEYEKIPGEGLKRK